ncbi:MAG: type I DNA topoisomerase [Lachnospiraceae bacterium]|nr:type I DNA topoisomerase [Lachnospiraceae bacterium]
MAKNLVIVESPTKVKTIRKFLGSNYQIVASAGHVRDLPKSSLGIDIEHDYEPKYITIRGKGDTVAALKKEVKKADRVYLATDPDREGEAIAWHLVSALKLENNKYSRISFNEITKKAIQNSIKNPREIDMDLVDAQQTRRILDRMVGYRISPVLWAKVKRGLSAGRVQSVTLRMISDRENAINAFIPEEYWTIDANIGQKGKKTPIRAAFYGTKDSKMEPKTEAEVNAILKALKKVDAADIRIDEIKKTTRTRKSPNPFTTSTLQQEASKALNFSTRKTMQIAQKLYEGVDVKDHGTVGLITYLRTDSIRISDEADAAVREYIGKTYGSEYIIADENGTAKNASGTSTRPQDAHEAIRPSDLSLTPQAIKDSLSRDEFRLYQLIWNRFVASRMAAAVYENTSVRFLIRSYVFTAGSSKVVFDGFLSVYEEKNEDEEKPTSFSVSESDTFTSLELNPKQHFTQPPAHYTEASLVKTMEEKGIGRPSTYAPTITTLLARHYITKENRNLYMTELGEVVNSIMVESFPSIVDTTFTASMESLLDSVADGTIEWKTVVRNFYPDLDESVCTAEKDLEKVTIKEEVTDVICEKCGRNMVVKYGPHGKFLGCPGFPECKNTKPLLEKAGVPCPVCGKDVVIRRSRKGRRYYGCIDNPDCSFVSWQKPVPGVVPVESENEPKPV